MIEVGALRLNLLRCGYLLLVIGLGSAVWPSILDPATLWSADRGVIVTMLAALSLLALIGIRHPLRMLPLLFWEVTWKLIWLCRIAFPSWRGNGLDPATSQTAIECAMAILLIAVIPWDHVYRVYVRGRGEPWRRARG